jgi:GNAT superfamily N-acetyltransferase
MLRAVRQPLCGAVMKSRKIKMTIEEFHRLPFRPAWKQEYYKGFLIETPRQAVAHATISIHPRLAQSPVPLRPVLAEDEQVLLPCFKSAFEDAFEFCDYTRENFQEAAIESLRRTFGDPAHPCLQVSRVALGPTESRDANKPIGAALTVQLPDNWVLLDALFVMPKWQRRGIANALVAAAQNELHKIGGYCGMVSRYYLGNEPSRAWHHRFGFKEEPDFLLARLYLRAATQELTRLRALGTLTPDLERNLTRERVRWETEVERLDSLLDQDKEEEAIPWRKWKR